MERRPLSATGLHVGHLGLGTMVLGDWGNRDLDACHRIINRALDAGVNLVDTADMYADGQNEEIVGRAIAAVIFGGWTLKGTVAGCIVFAGALSFRLSLQVLGYDQINSEFLQALPFLVTIFGMAIFATRVRPPAALARPFIRGLK